MGSVTLIVSSVFEVDLVQCGFVSVKISFGRLALMFSLDFMPPRNKKPEPELQTPEYKHKRVSFGDSKTNGLADCTVTYWHRHV